MAARRGKLNSPADQSAREKAEAAAGGRRGARSDRHAVTLADVGQLAGVSPSTVSRVVSNRTAVSPEVREVVERAIVRLGYVPNRAARSLATSRSGAIGVLIYEPYDQWSSDPFIPPMLFGISEGLAQTDVQIVLMMAASRRDEERAQRYLQNSHLDGVILVGSHSGDSALDQIVRLGVPIVFNGRPALDIDVDYVDADHRSGSRTAVSHLAATGCRRIATIHGPLDMPSSRDKLEGYQDALIAGGLPFDAALVAPGNYNPTLAAEAIRTLLAEHPDIDGVFVASDMMAAAVVDVILEAGLRIPDDIAVVGYDDTPVAVAIRPKLTTVRQPIEAMGRAMVQLLLRRVDHPDEPTSRVIFTTELIIRDSSGVPIHPGTGRSRTQTEAASERP